MQIQQYELKVGVVSHQQLQINDLLQYLHLQLNQYLSLQVKKIAMGSKSNQKFTAAFEKIIQTDIEEQEYVGFIFIYNNTKFDSLQHVKRELQGLDLKGSDETFLVLAELEGKSLNIAMDEGMLLAEKYQGKFIKLSYENSEEIVSVIRSYVHTMIQNYYFPQEIIDEEDDNQSDHNKQYELNYVSKNVELTEEEEKKINRILEDQPGDEPYLLRISKKNLNTKGLLEQAEKQIDGNIKNLEKVLNNMDVHIKSRVENEWFKDLKRTIYSKVEKQSTKFSRIKLTQHFLDQGNDIIKYKTPLETILLKKRKNLLMHLKFNIGEGKTVQLDVFEDSNYGQLAKQALRKIGLKVTEKNQMNIQRKIETIVGKFVAELHSAISSIHKERINKRKFLVT